MASTPGRCREWFCALEEQRRYFSGVFLAAFCLDRRKAAAVDGASDFFAAGSMVKSGRLFRRADRLEHRGEDLITVYERIDIVALCARREPYAK
jgi:hypothetical protein